MTITSIGTPEVTQLVANISAIYSPELIVGLTAVCIIYVIHEPCMLTHMSTDVLQ